MIDREAAIQKMRQIVNRAKELKQSHGLSFEMAMAFEYSLQATAECINDVDAYEMAFKMGRELRELAA